MKPDIAVVIATWQRPALLNRCLNALVNQSIDESRYEIIIATDGPDPITEKFMKSWLKNFSGKLAVTCMSLPVKKGPAAARNAGWRKAHGELIVFTDDDCMPRPGCLEQYWQAYMPYRDTAIAFSGQIKVPLTGSPDEAMAKTGMPTDYEMNTRRLEQARFVTANCACSRQYIITLMLLLALVFSFNNTRLMAACMIVWFLLTAWFTWKRLRNTSRTLLHITEMAFTSAIIPVLSVYWTIYGAVKFKTFFV
jgi:glycosyltransferase involved in cell wall biosynthesis